MNSTLQWVCSGLLLIGVIPLNAAASSKASNQNSAFDVVIYGGTSAAVTAAVQVKRMHKTVAIVCPEQHLGGLTAGGLGWTDSGRKDAIGGVSREFYHRIWKHYQKPAAWTWQAQAEFGNRNQSPPGPDGDGATLWVFEPHVAEQVFEDFVSEYKIPVFRDQWLDRTPVSTDPSASPRDRQRTQGVVMQNDRITAIRMVGGR